MNQRVAIIIPTFNRAQLIMETLGSVRNQTYADWECIIVDDHSTDDTIAAVQQFVDKDSRFKFLTNTKSKGAQGARNTGFDYATASMVMFLDSDDLLHPAKLELQVNALLADPTLDMVYGLDEYFTQVPGDGSVLWNLPGKDDDIDRFLYDDIVFHTQSPIWKKDALVRLGLEWNESIICWQDWLYHLTALARGIKYTCIYQVLGYIRDHNGARSTDHKIIRKETSKLNATLVVIRELTSTKKMSPVRAGYITSFLNLILINTFSVSNAESKAVNDIRRKAIIETKKLNTPNRLVSKFGQILLKAHFVTRLRFMVLKLLKENYANYPFPENTWKCIDSSPYRINASYEAKST